MHRIVVYPEAQDRILALPDHALTSYADLSRVLELTPWNGLPHDHDNRDGALRRWHFGPGEAGNLVYLVLEDLHEVHIVMVQWLGPAG